MATTQFGEWLRTQRQTQRFTIEELALKAGLSKQYVSVLERGQPHPLTNKPVKPTPETVEKLAKALGIELDQARTVAGYAPTKQITKPTNLGELIQALEALGLPVPQLHGGYEQLLQDSGTYEEALRRIVLDLELLLRRGGMTVEYVELPISGGNQAEEQQRKWK